MGGPPTACAPLDPARNDPNPADRFTVLIVEHLAANTADYDR